MNKWISQAINLVHKVLLMIINNVKIYFDFALKWVPFLVFLIEESLKWHVTTKDTLAELYFWFIDI